MFIGYHGTTLAAAVRILMRVDTNEYWLRSRNEYDWLGDGIYFFQDAPLRALLYAEKKASSQAGEEPAIIAARFKLETCLDLLDVGATNYLRKIHEASSEADQPPLPSQRRISILHKPRENIVVGRGRSTRITLARRHLLDRVIVNRTVMAVQQKFRRKVDAVRCAFVDGRPPYPTSWLYDLAHVQVCVRSVRKCLIGTPELISYQDLCELRDRLNSDIDKLGDDRRVPTG
jgi:hypothetical protein